MQRKGKVLSDSSTDAAKADGCTVCDQPLLSSIYTFTILAIFSTVVSLLWTRSLLEIFLVYVLIVSSCPWWLCEIWSNGPLNQKLVPFSEFSYWCFLLNNEHCKLSRLPPFFWVNKFVQSVGVAALYPLWDAAHAVHTLLQRYLWPCVRSWKCPLGIRAGCWLPVRIHCPALSPYQFLCSIFLTSSSVHCHPR